MLAIALTQSGDLDERLALAFDMYDYNNTGTSKLRSLLERTVGHLDRLFSRYQRNGQSHCCKCPGHSCSCPRRRWNCLSRPCMTWSVKLIAKVIASSKMIWTRAGISSLLNRWPRPKTPRRRNHSHLRRYRKQEVDEGRSKHLEKKESWSWHPCVFLVHCRLQEWSSHPSFTRSQRVKSNQVKWTLTRKILLCSSLDFTCRCALFIFFSFSSWLFALTKPNQASVISIPCLLNKREHRTQTNLYWQSFMRDERSS